MRNLVSSLHIVQQGMAAAQEGLNRLDRVKVRLNEILAANGGKLLETADGSLGIDLPKDMPLKDRERVVAQLSEAFKDGRTVETEQHLKPKPHGLVNYLSPELVAHFAGQGIRAKEGDALQWQSHMGGYALFIKHPEGEPTWVDIKSLPRKVAKRACTILSTLMYTKEAPCPLGDS